MLPLERTTWLIAGDASESLILRASRRPSCLGEGRCPATRLPGDRPAPGLGASRRHVAEQFLAEAVILSVLGGMAGTVIGGAATAIYAATQHWSVQTPLWRYTAA